MKFRACEAALPGAAALMPEPAHIDLSRLGALLTFLSEAWPREPGQFRGWTFRRVSGGANNLVYRVRESDETYAVKFCLADERDRAGREYAALSLLNEFSIPLAPKALLLEREHYTLPVVVQAWLEGEVMRAPVIDDDWDTLLTYYADLHRVTQSPGAVARALHTASSVAEGRALIRGQLEHLPEAAYPSGLNGVLERDSRRGLAQTGLSRAWRYAASTLTPPTLSVPVTVCAQ